MGYRAIDEVNQHLALQLAAECGVALAVVWPRDVLPDSRFGAVLYDLDCLPFTERERSSPACSRGRRSGRGQSTVTIWRSHRSKPCARTG
jgi:hypothetical protein